MNEELKIKKFVRNLLICLLVYLFIGSITARAISPTIQPSANENFGEKINDLKERIASRVAELKLVERRGVLGKVTNVTNTQITLSDSQNNIRFVDVDEITKFSSPSAKGSFGISDISKGTNLGVLGLYNKESRRTLARFVDVLDMPSIFHGAIASINNDDFSFEINTADKKSFTIDVEKSTRTLSYSKGGNLIRSGFAKLKEGYRVIVVGFLNPKNTTRVIATKIIFFTDIPRNPAIILSQPTLTPEPSISPTPISTRKTTTQ